MILSYSQISQLLRCGRAYEFAYIKQLPAILNPHLISGRCLDRALTYAFNKKRNQIPVTKEDLMESVIVFFEDEINQKSQSIDWQGEEPEALKERLRTLAGLYYDEVFNEIKPISIQERWETRIGDILFIGYTDLIDSTPSVIDFKYSRRRMSEKELDNDIQSVGYSLLTGLDNFAFHQLLDIKKPEIVIYRKKVEDNQRKWFEELVISAARLIENQIFVPNPFNYSCSLEGCSWFAQCRLGI